MTACPAVLGRPAGHAPASTNATVQLALSCGIRSKRVYVAMLKTILICCLAAVIGLGGGWFVAQYQISDFQRKAAGLYRFGPWITARDETALASLLTLAQTDRIGPFGMRA